MAFYPNCCPHRTGEQSFLTPFPNSEKVDTKAGRKALLNEEADRMARETFDGYRDGPKTETAALSELQEINESVRTIKKIAIWWCVLSIITVVVAVLYAIDSAMRS
jgi:hypothetical protein